MNLRAGDSVSAIAKVVSSRGAAEDASGEELMLEEIAGELEEGVDSATANGASPNGEVAHG